MENKLEELLNSLIEKGFIPFNIPEITEIKYISTKNKLRITSHQNNRDYKDDFSLRDIVSKSSWLWQFVCENGMVKKSIISREYFNTLWWCRITFRDENMAFWLIESSLKDESELEDFLLNSIKLD